MIFIKKRVSVVWNLIIIELFFILEIIINRIYGSRLNDILGYYIILLIFMILLVTYTIIITIRLKYNTIDEQLSMLIGVIGIGILNFTFFWRIMIWLL